MQFTVKEMEVLCVFHAGTLSKTLEAAQFSVTLKNERRERLEDIESIIKKLSAMTDSDIAFIAFEPEQ